MQTVLNQEEADVAALCGRLRLLHPLHQLSEYEQRGTQAVVHLVQMMRHTLGQEEHRLQGLAGRLQALSPLAVLARGYSITFRLPDRRVVTEAASVQVGDILDTLVARGRITSRVTDTTPTQIQEYHGAAK
jgi:exodeoxyribonuclease VII large subunit